VLIVGEVTRKRRPESDDVKVSPLHTLPARDFEVLPSGD
jgi:hypothetical protein